MVIGHNIFLGQGKTVKHKTINTIIPRTSHSILISIALYIIVVMFTMDSLISHKEKSFDLFTSSLTEINHSLYLLGLVVQKEIDLSEIPANKIMENKILDNIIINSKNDQYISFAAYTFHKTLKYIFNTNPSVTVNHKRLFYRDYITSSVTMLQNKDIAKDAEWFHWDNCELHNACSKFGSPYSLKDRIVFSPVVTLPESGTIGIFVSTPIFYEHKVVGDLNIFIDMSHLPMLKEKTIHRYERNGSIVTTIVDTRYPLYYFSYVREYVADNRNIFVYKIPVFEIIEDTWWILSVLFVFTLFTLTKISELNINKIHLKDARTSVTKDQLTGLYNRHIFEEESFISNMEKTAATVIAIDGNKIKHINDTYGHNVGDEAIKHIAVSMQQTFRETDYLIRVGGDEFIAILPGCELEIAGQLVTQLQHNVQNGTFAMNVPSISISVGIEEKGANEQLAPVLRRADIVLYQNKSASRDKAA